MGKGGSWKFDAGRVERESRRQMGVLIEGGVFVCRSRIIQSEYCRDCIRLVYVLFRFSRIGSGVTITLDINSLVTGPSSCFLLHCLEGGKTI